MITETRVRELLLQVWGDQACRIKRDDWPAVFSRLMESTPQRGSLKAFVDDGVPALTALANSNAVIPADAVWRAFSKLDRDHVIRLAILLEVERGVIK